MWSANKSIPISLDDGRTKVTVTYTDDSGSSRPISVDYFIWNFVGADDNWIKRQAIEYLASLDNAKGALIKITPGLIDLTPFTKIDESEKLIFLSDVAHLQRLFQLVNMGVLALDNSEVVALKDKIIAEYKPEYLE